MNVFSQTQRYKALFWLSLFHLLVMSWAGVPVIYLAAAGLVAIALLLTWRLKKRPPEHVPEAASSS